MNELSFQRRREPWAAVRDCRCSSVGTDRNFDRNGKRSKVIATLPVTTEQSLNSSVTHYRDLTSDVSVVSGDHNVFEFKVGTNLEKEVDLRVMLELYLE